jgi:putative intracellular protease/amidase
MQIPVLPALWAVAAAVLAVPATPLQTQGLEAKAAHEAKADREAPASAPAKSAAPRKVAIVLFPGVELLDFAGPGEVFAAAHGKGGPCFHTFTVAETKDPLKSQGFVTVTPQYALDDCPKPDIVVLPGGDVPTHSVKLREWVQARSKDTELMMSVCNGALVYAAAGLLKGLEATTHHSALQGLAVLEPEAKVFTNRRFVDNGRVLTAAGIAAGIDGALHVVERLCGEDVAWSTARGMEYDWRPDEIARLHAQPGTPVEGIEGLRWVRSIRQLGLKGALAEYATLPKPPTEQKINGWGYSLMRAGHADEAVDVFRFVADAFPASANAMDSLSEALETKKDRAGAEKAAKECLARLEQAKDVPAERRAMIRNASASRIARLSGAPASSFRYECPPCGGECDGLGFLEASSCPNCGMPLVERKELADKKP